MNPLFALTDDDQVYRRRFCFSILFISITITEVVKAWRKK